MLQLYQCVFAGNILLLRLNFWLLLSVYSGKCVVHDFSITCICAGDAGRLWDKMRVACLFRKIGRERNRFKWKLNTVYSVSVSDQKLQVEPRSIVLRVWPFSVTERFIHTHHNLAVVGVLFCGLISRRREYFVGLSVAGSLELNTREWWQLLILPGYVDLIDAVYIYIYII